MKRGFVAVLLAVSLVGTEAQSSISITTLDRTSAPTFGQVVINGNGFLTTAAISVVFTARDAVTTTVPVAAVTPGSVRVAVPPFISSANGDLFDTSIVADVQVVQVTSTSVMTSNVLGGLTITPLPQADGTPGTFTRAFLRTLLDVQNDLRTSRRSSSGFGDVVAKSQTFTDAQASLLDGVDLILRSQDATANLPTPDNLPLSLGARTLRAMDRVGSGFVLQANSIYRTAEPNPPARSTSCACNPISDLDRSLCEFRQNPCGGYDPGRRVNTDVAASLYGAQFGALGGWAAGGLSNVGSASETAGGIGLIFGQAFAYVASVMAGTDPPGSSSLRDAGMQMLEDLINSGLGVFSGTKSATELTVAIESLVNQTKGAVSTAPLGGLLTPAPLPLNPPSNTRPHRVYTGATGVGPKWIATPITQQVTTVTATTLASPAVARFNGTYSGTSGATCTISGPDIGSVTQSASAPISGVVAQNGSITGGGTISETGRFTSPTESAAGLTCTSGGFFWSVGLGPGDAGATGSITCSGGVPGASIRCSGTWVLRRQ